MSWGGILGCLWILISRREADLNFLVLTFPMGFDTKRQFVRQAYNRDVIDKRERRWFSSKEEKGSFGMVYFSQ